MQSNITTLPNPLPPNTVINYTPNFSAFCSVGKAPFNGVIEIVYKPNKVILEFESFEQWVFNHSTDNLTIEDYTMLVYNTLKGILSPNGLTVTVKAKTIKHKKVEVMINDG